MFAQTPDGSRLSIYTAQTGFTLPVAQRDNVEYVGLLEALEPLGNVSATTDKRKWKLRFNNVEGEFQEGKSKAKIAGKDVELTAKFFLQNGRGQVPTASLPAVIAAVTGIQPEFHAAARRLFVGASPIRYSVRVQKGATTSLVLSFSAPVNPTISTESGRVRLQFVRDPVVGGSSDPFPPTPPFQSAGFIESNGAAEVAIQVTGPVLARLSDANKTVTLAAPPPPAAAPTQGAAPAPIPPASTPPAPVQPSRPAFVVLLDPAHGGDDRGATLSETLLEKDVVLTLARRVRGEFEARGTVAKLMRDGDATLTPDTRAAIVNGSTPNVVVFLHATTSGNGVHVATAGLTPDSHPGAVPRWATAQAGFVDSSRDVAETLAGELLKRDIAAVRLNASVPPLAQTAVPAVVVEIAPPVDGSANDIAGQNYSRAIANAIADAVLKRRARLTREVAQ